MGRLEMKFKPGCIHVTLDGGTLATFPHEKTQNAFDKRRGDAQNFIDGINMGMQLMAAQF